MRKFDNGPLIFTLAISWLAAIIEFSTNHRPIVYLSYGIIVPLLMFLPRVMYVLHKNFYDRFNTRLVSSVEFLSLWIVIINAPASLWLHSMGFQYDRFLHFAVNVINIPLIILMISALGVETRKKLLIIGTSVVVIGLFLFEGYQYSVDLMFGTHLFHDAAQNIRIDVAEDIIFGILGVLFGLYLSLYRLNIFKNLEPGGSYRIQK